MDVMIFVWAAVAIVGLVCFSLVFPCDPVVSGSHFRSEDFVDTAGAYALEGSVSEYYRHGNGYRNKGRTETVCQ